MNRIIIKATNATMPHNAVQASQRPCRACEGRGFELAHTWAGANEAVRQPCFECNGTGIVQGGRR